MRSGEVQSRAYRRRRQGQKTDRVKGRNEGFWGQPQTRRLGRWGVRRGLAAGCVSCTREGLKLQRLDRFREQAILAGEVWSEAELSSLSPAYGGVVAGKAVLATSQEANALTQSSNGAWAHWETQLFGSMGVGDGL